MKTSYRVEKERRIAFLKSLELFDTWVKSDIKLLNASSKTVEYGDKVILRENSKMAVVKSKGKAEFLRVDKEDIEKVWKFGFSFS